MSALFPELVLWEMLPSRLQGAEQMAIDEWLLTQAPGPLPKLRLYQWSSPAVTYGYFQSPTHAEEAFPGLPNTRRWTGGGVVAHGIPLELTYALAIPRGDPFFQVAPREGYECLHRALQGALDEVGVTTTFVETSSTGTQCFQHPAKGDLLLPSGKKAAGAAQRRSRHGALIQGSIRLEETIPDRLPAALANHLAGKRVTGPPLDGQAIDQLVRARYGTDAWRYRIK